jgi:hypothetical protein
MKLMELCQDKIMGAISGLDRIRFRGTLRWLATQSGLRTLMSHTRILLKDFCGWVNGLTGLIRDSCETRAGQFGIEVPLFLEMDSCLRRNDKRNGIFTSLRTCCPRDSYRLRDGVLCLIFNLL